jgi:cytoskeletal protein CcmA (bactofilin family)
MNLECNLYIDGKFEGTIYSDKDVNIGKNGHVKGNIYANRLIIQGYIEGVVSSSAVEIKASGRVNGTIEASELVVEAKGIFEGNSIVRDVAPAPKSIEITKKIKSVKSVKSIKSSEPEAKKEIA